MRSSRLKHSRGCPEGQALAPFCGRAHSGCNCRDPSLREHVAIGEDAQRGDKQLALFASGDFDIVPKALTMSVGMRRYHYDDFENGSQYYSQTTDASILNHPDGACTMIGLGVWVANQPCQERERLRRSRQPVNSS